MNGIQLAKSYYDAYGAELLAQFPETEIRAQKTQVSFYDGRLYACASLAAVRRKAERPDPYLTVTFSLDAPSDSPRLVCVPVRKNRFTHHAIIGDPADIDDELLGWLHLSRNLR